MIFHFIGIFNKDDLVGVAVSQFLDLSAIASFGERDHRFKTYIRSYVFQNISSRVLVIGNNMLTGQNGYSFSKELDKATAFVVLKDATNTIQLLLAKRNLKPQLIIFKDYSKEAVSLFDKKIFKSYFTFTTQPNMIFKISDNWNSFDDYLASLSKKYRDQYKRSRKKAEAVSKRKLSLDEIESDTERIHELYLNVARNAPFNTFYLSENHFEIFKKTLKDNFLFYGYFIDDKLIGFNTLIKNGSDIDTYFLGYDQEFQKEKMLYLNMLYDMIAYSINKKYKRIIFARTALEIKSSVGATAVDTYGMMKHSNPLLNLFIGRFFRYFEPKSDWQVRNPFKE
ncbi:GNAT family N-acetyltransferase [Flavobacterium sp. 14A]|uniref:GNAT family N-acetyltransferase n=1 Tax=Flavobacterium sp. 14A TaxID=2735896 RepID=UPI0020C5B97D|nr:GNAT family N-acetyltransferase [Flavobacterium sp. 14A]NRT11454.1 putative N-acyltransferase [Flavobacterium sp. 14A]